MKVLVTGGAGYVGSVVTERLIAVGEEVIVLDDLSAGHREAVHPKAQFVEGDIGDRATLDATLEGFGVDAVMHMAAKALIPESVTNPALFYAVNMTAAANLLESVRQHGVGRFVMSSTAAVYGEPERIPIDEDHRTRPLNSYGETKLSFERMLYWYARAYGLNVTVFRYFSAAGATAERGELHMPETHLLPRLIRAALDGAAAEVYGSDYDTPDGTCIRDFVHVEDVAEAHRLALTVPNPSGFRVFNVGSGSGYSVLEAITTVEKVTGRRLERRMLPRRAGDPARLVASSARLARDLGWRPRLQSLEAIIDSAWRWHRAHPAGY